MIEFIKNDVLPLYTYIALFVCLIGIIYKFLRYGWYRAKGKREMNERTGILFPAKKRSLLRSFWMVNFRSFSDFWARANPVTFAGHILYHVGLFVAIGIYSLVAILSFDRIARMSLPETVSFIFDFFQHTEEIFGKTGFIALAGNALVSLFIIALVFAATGMSIPFIMSALHKRGMEFPIDHPLQAAGIRTSGLSRSSSGGSSRKVIGFIALVMDLAMLSTFIFTVPGEFAGIVHVSFALTIIALIPFSFLFHEVYRLRMWGAVRRIRDGRI